MQMLPTKMMQFENVEKHKEKRVHHVVAKVSLEGSRELWLSVPFLAPDMGSLNSWVAG